MKNNLGPKARIGDYDLVSRIGEGGFGSVWLARDRQTAEMVAIKVFVSRPGLTTEQDNRQKERIKYEADVVRSLSKTLSGVPKYVSSGMWHGSPYFAMENLVPLMGNGYRGLPVYDSVKWDDSEVRRFVLALLDAVDSIHKLGWVHCDIKPSNLMQRGDDPTPVLVDFGSAHIVEAESRVPTEKSISVLPNGNRVLPFTPGYADPSEDMHTVHGDIYAIGQVIRDLFQEDVPLVWAAIINKCLSRNREYRYATVSAVREDVENIKRARFREYRRLRISEIGESLAAQKASAHYRKCVVAWQDLLGEAKKGKRGCKEFNLDLRTHELFKDGPVDCRITGALELPDHAILIITGPGVLRCKITGPRTSAVVLHNDLTLHNAARQDGKDNQCVYIQTGETYLDFTHRTAKNPNIRRSLTSRVFRSMSAFTELGFGGNDTIFDVRKASIDRARKTSLPLAWKKKLVNYMRGTGFVYYEGRG